MRYLFAALITVYQRWLSPLKGFDCAYRIRHQSESCSHAVRALILKHGFIKALPLIRSRFSQCRKAYNDLKSGYLVPEKADLPCDLSCDAPVDCCNSASELDDCGVGCDDFFDLLKGWRRLSSRAKRRVVVGFLLILFVLSYVFYGRAISAVYLTDLGFENQGFIAKLAQREQPQVRVLLVVDGEKIYTEIAELSSTDITYRLPLEDSLFSFDIQRLEVIDARINVANELFVVGQVLEAFDAPNQSGQGKRFKYRLKRRWHF